MIVPPHILRENIPHGFRWLLPLLLVPALLVLVQCDAPRRENPFDPGGAAEISAAESPALALRVPLPKALATVVGRVEATLEGPGMHPVVKVLEHQPLGPAQGVIGALQPGEGRVLTVRGFDLDGGLLFEGEARGIAVVAGDTLRLSLDLFLVNPAPGDGEEPSDPDPAPEGGEGSGDEPDPVGGETDGTDPADGETDGNETDGTDPADGETDGSETDGTDPVGGEADGSETDGTDPVGGEADGSETDGTVPVGGEADGSETDGTDPAGEEADGTDSAEPDAASDAEGSSSEDTP